MLAVSGEVATHVLQRFVQDLLSSNPVTNGIPLSIQHHSLPPEGKKTFDEILPFPRVTPRSFFFLLDFLARRCVRQTDLRDILYFRGILLSSSSDPLAAFSTTGY